MDTFYSRVAFPKTFLWLWSDSNIFSPNYPEHISKRAARTKSNSQQKYVYIPRLFLYDVLYFHFDVRTSAKLISSSALSKQKLLNLLL